MQSLTLQQAQTKNILTEKKTASPPFTFRKKCHALALLFRKKKRKIFWIVKQNSNTDLKKFGMVFWKWRAKWQLFFLRWRPIRGSTECSLVDIEPKIALSAATELRTLKVESRQTQSIVCFWSFNGTEDCVRVKCTLEQWLELAFVAKKFIYCVILRGSVFPNISQ